MEELQSSQEDNYPMFELAYPNGWQEILEATDPEAVEYQLWLDGLVGLSTQKLEEMDNAPEWSDHAGVVKNRWQKSIETIDLFTVGPHDSEVLTESERVESALLTLQANIESIGWREEGLALIIPNSTTGEEVTIDIRNIVDIPNN